MPELFGHPFSSYTWKALIALYENDTPFTFQMIDPDHQENVQRILTLSPQGKFPVLIDGEREICESSMIIEYLQHYYPGQVALLPPDKEQAITVRMFDRFFDNYVMTPTQHIVNDFMRIPSYRDTLTVNSAKAMLQQTYGWLNKHLQNTQYACGDAFTLADCAAAPSLFYADWVHEIGQEHTHLRRYRTRLLARPSVERCVDEARPYRSLIPPGAPNRD